jgi:hypothetical protein
MVTVNGITEALGDACRRYGTKYAVAFRRLKRGRPHEQALLAPLRSNGYRRHHSRMKCIDIREAAIVEEKKETQK